MKNFKNKLHGSGTTALIALCISFLVFIYAPLELYLTNISEFWMKLSEIAFPIAVMFAVCFLAVFSTLTVAKLISENLYNIGLTVGASFVVSTYIQGNFLVKNLPSMNGSKVDWNAYPAERLKSILVFAIPLAILFFVYIKFKGNAIKKIASIGSVCAILLLGVTLTSLFITTDTKKTDNLVATVQNEFQMSGDKNLIVLILDSVDSGMFMKELKKDGELINELDGFTYYDNALAAYPFTSRSLPMIFSGQWFENEGNFEEYRTKAVASSPFMNELERQNYKIGIYEKWDLGLAESEFKGKTDNCYHAYIDNKAFSTYNLIFKMYGAKFAPWDIKRYCWNTDEFSIYCRMPESDYKKFQWGNEYFYNKINEPDSFETVPERCARIIHLDGAHVPFRYDKNMNKIDNGTYEDKVGACITLIKKYISCLKENGVYDNSAIVILADHGYSGNDNSDDYNLIKRLNPLLMVKGADEKHKMNVSSAPIAYEDIADGIKNLVTGKKSNEIFEYSDGDSRQRRAILYRYLKEKNMKEFITDGRADDPDAVRATGKEYNLAK